MGSTVALKRHWILYNEKKKNENCVLFLPGRYNVGLFLGRYYRKAGLRKTLLVSVAPKHHQWYPMPNGAGDQRAALAGLPAARQTINSVLDRIEKKYGIPRERTVLAGFSAGAVMAIDVAAHSDRPFAGVISHVGAILNPFTLPPCKHRETSFLIIHYKDDIVFSWEERYLPMVYALDRQGYRFYVKENEFGGHTISAQDVYLGSCFTKKCFSKSMSYDS